MPKLSRCDGIANIAAPFIHCWIRSGAIGPTRLAMSVTPARWSIASTAACVSLRPSPAISSCNSGTSQRAMATAAASVAIFLFFQSTRLKAVRTSGGAGTGGITASLARTHGRFTALRTRLPSRPSTQRVAHGANDMICAASCQQPRQRPARSGRARSNFWSLLPCTVSMNGTPSRPASRRAARPSTVSLCPCTRSIFCSRRRRSALMPSATPAIARARRKPRAGAA